MTGFFDNTLDIHNSILRRKHAVQEKLTLLRGHDCKNAPDVPCCLLQTELEVLGRYKDVIERELYHSDIPKEDICNEPSWVERLRQEWNDLCNRMEKLDNFRDRFRQGDIDFVPKWDERLLCDQLRAMRTYRDCLLQYAKLEGIELDMTIYDDTYRYDYYFSDNQEA